MKIDRTKIIPQGKMCLIEPYKSADKDESGWMMDNSSNTSAAPVLGTIIRVGEQSKFKAGDIIFFRRYSIDSLKFISEKGEETVDLVEEQDIIAKVEN